MIINRRKPSTEPIVVIVNKIDSKINDLYSSDRADDSNFLFWRRSVRTQNISASPEEMQIEIADSNSTELIKDLWKNLRFTEFYELDYRFTSELETSDLVIEIIGFTYEIADPIADALKRKYKIEFEMIQAQKHKEIDKKIAKNKENHVTIKFPANNPKSVMYIILKRQTSKTCLEIINAIREKYNSDNEAWKLNRKTSWMEGLGVRSNPFKAN